jgi:hypothetical protein
LRRVWSKPWRITNKGKILDPFVTQGEEEFMWPSLEHTKPPKEDTCPIRDVLYRHSCREKRLLHDMILSITIHISAGVEINAIVLHVRKPFRLGAK